MTCADQPTVNIPEKKRVEISDEIPELGIAAEAAHPRQSDIEGARYALFDVLNVRNQLFDRFRVVKIERVSKRAPFGRAS